MSPTSIKHFIAFLTAALLFGAASPGALAQQAPPAKESLATAAPEPAETPAAPVKERVQPAQPVSEVPFKPSLRFGMNMGTMVSAGLGSASYAAPTAYYNFTPRFRAFGSLNMMHLQYPGFRTGDAGTTAPFRSNHVLMQVGGQYDASERLTLTGSVWRDLSSMPASYQGYRHPMLPGNSGMSLRADLKITDNLSVSGGLRYGNGNRNTFGNPMLVPGAFGHGPFGY